MSNRTAILLLTLRSVLLVTLDLRMFNIPVSSLYVSDKWLGATRLCDMNWIFISHKGVAGQSVRRF